MKKLLPLLLCLLLLVSCAKTPGLPDRLPEKPPKDTSETVTEPEKAPEGTTETPEKEPEQVPEEEPEKEPEETPEAPQDAVFSVYYGNENADALLSEEVAIPELTPEAVAAELIRVGVLPEGTLVNRLAVVGSYLYLDLSTEFLTKLHSMGTSGEWVTVGSVVNTFLDAYEVDTLLLSVNGSVIETGHTVYDFPLTRFENPGPAAEEVRLTVYRGNDNADAIIAEEVTVAEVTPEVIVEQLILAGVLSDGCAVNSIDATAAGISLDMNEAFRTHVCSMGTTGEWIVLGSLTNTFLTAYGSETLSLTVDGQLLETGHNVYDFPLPFTP